MIVTDLLDQARDKSEKISKDVTSCQQVVPNFRVAKKPRVRGYHPGGRFAKWAVSEEGLQNGQSVRKVCKMDSQ